MNGVPTHPPPSFSTRICFEGVVCLDLFARRTPSQCDRRDRPQCQSVTCQHWCVTPRDISLSVRDECDVCFSVSVHAVTHSTSKLSSVMSMVVTQGGFMRDIEKNKIPSCAKGCSHATRKWKRNLVIPTQPQANRARVDCRMCTRTHGNQ